LVESRTTPLMVTLEGFWAESRKGKLSNKNKARLDIFLIKMLNMVPEIFIFLNGSKVPKIVLPEILINVKYFLPKVIPNRC